MDTFFRLLSPKREAQRHVVDLTQPKSKSSPSISNKENELASSVKPISLQDSLDGSYWNSLAPRKTSRSNNSTHTTSLVLKFRRSTAEERANSNSDEDQTFHLPTSTGASFLRKENAIGKELQQLLEDSFDGCYWKFDAGQRRRSRSRRQVTFERSLSFTGRSTNQQSSGVFNQVFNSSSKGQSWIVTASEGDEQPKKRAKIGRKQAFPVKELKGLLSESFDGSYWTFDDSQPRTRSKHSEDRVLYEWKDSEGNSIESGDLSSNDDKFADLDVSNAPREIKQLLGSSCSFDGNYWACFDPRRRIREKHLKRQAKIFIAEETERNKVEEKKAARLRALHLRVEDPDVFFFSFLDDYETAKTGSWSQREREEFLNAIATHQRDRQQKRRGWGMFSRSIPGRTGKQCKRYFKSLIADGVLSDPDYFCIDGKVIFRGTASSVELAIEDYNKRKERARARAQLAAAKRARKSLERALELEAVLQQQSVGVEVFNDRGCSIYLGSILAAENIEWMKEAQLSAVVNVSRDLKNRYPENFKYMRIPIDDSIETRIDDYFEHAVSFISSQVDQGSTGVLVHCREGRSRSAAILVAYAMLKLDKSLREAYYVVCCARPEVNINDGFKHRLMELEAGMRGDLSLNFFQEREVRRQCEETLSAC